MNNTLLPCPFCGGEADIEEIPGSPFTNEPYVWAVGCEECNIGWYEETKEAAIAAWNRRADTENKPLTCGGCQNEPHDKNGRYVLGKDNLCYGCRRNPNTKDAYRHKPERSDLDA